MLTRKDFNALAGIIRVMDTTSSKDEWIKVLAGWCSGQNPRFNRERFLDACGYVPTVHIRLNTVPVRQAVDAARQMIPDGWTVQEAIGCDLCGDVIIPGRERTLIDYDELGHRTERTCCDACDMTGEVWDGDELES